MSHLYWYTPDVFSCVSSFAYSTCRWGICTGSAYNSDLIVCSDNLNKKQTPFVIWLLMQSDIICMTELRKVIPVIIFRVNLRIKASAVWSFKSWRSGRWHLCNVKKNDLLQCAFYKKSYTLLVEKGEVLWLKSGRHFHCDANWVLRFN